MKVSIRLSERDAIFTLMGGWAGRVICTLSKGSSSMRSIPNTEYR
jgi:hypothetical protein